jgi:hypothetical protein
MAKKTTVILVDDIDGIEIEDGKGETVFFALDGVSYEIDLSEKNATALRSDLDKWVNAGRRANRATRTVAPVSNAHRNSPKELAAARDWLRAKGHKVSDRGRIPATLLDEYRANA